MTSQTFSNYDTGDAVERFHLLDDVAAARVVVRKRCHDLPAVIGETPKGRQRGTHLLGGLFELGGHRMLAEENDRTRSIELQFATDQLGTGKQASGDQIERRLSDVEDPPGLLAQTEDSLDRLMIGREVKVRELGHRMTYGIIEG